MRRFVLTLMALTALALPACNFFRTKTVEIVTITDNAIPGPESRRLIAQARDLLYTGKAEDRYDAIELAKKVVANTIEPRYIWEGKLVIAIAYQGNGDTRAAQQTAMEAVNLALYSEPFDEQAETSVKMALPVFVQNAVQNLSLSEVLDQLAQWKKQLNDRIRLASRARRETLVSVEEEFKLMEQMARQIKASSNQHQKIRQMVRDYIALYNEKDVAKLIKMMEPQSEISKKLIAGGVAEIGKIEKMQIGSPVEIELDSERQEPTAASAVVDIIIISRAGWTDVSHRMRFSFVRYDENSWYIRDIQNHP